MLTLLPHDFIVWYELKKDYYSLAPATQAAYAPGSEPVQFLGRGYTGA